MSNNFIIITGATGGLGAALIHIALNNKLSCCAMVRSLEKLNTLFDNKDLFGIEFDMSQTISPDFALITPSLEFNRCNTVTLILNAFQISPITQIRNFSFDVIEANIQTNIISQINIVFCILKLCRKYNKNLRIIQIDSGAAYRPIEGWSLYCSSKAYMSMFLQTLQKEECIELVLYDPGVMDTNMQTHLRSIDKDQFPDVDLFQGFFENNQLHAPNMVAHDIFDRYVVNWTASQIKEYYGKK